MEKPANGSSVAAKASKAYKKRRGRRKKSLPSIPEKFKKEYFWKSITYKLSSLNPFITCPVCQGYLVDATTVTECLHSFCRSCIVKHLEKSHNCPLCNELVHKTNPLYNLRSDTALQDIVNKLLPGFWEEEERRRTFFYKSRGLPVPEKVTNKPSLLKQKQKHRHPRPPQQVSAPARVVPQEPPSVQSSTVYHADDQITMQLEMKSVEKFTEDHILPLKRKFVRCSAHVTVGLLQEFIARKLKLETATQVEIMCCDMELGTDFTLHYIKETIAPVEDDCKPLLLYYGLTQVD